MFFDKCFGDIRIIAPVDVFGVWTGPKDLLVGHRTSWGILPQTPVFSLRSTRSRWYSSITAIYSIYLVVFGQVQRTCWWVIGPPGGSSPRPPFYRCCGLSNNHQMINYTAVMELCPRQHAERSEKTGVWGTIPQEVR
jgi:hypothetical protein